jgi:molybdate/tungstate transport system substrate-binding protein
MMEKDTMQNLLSCRPLSAILVLAVTLLLPVSGPSAELQGDLIIFHAGSLTVPMAKMETVFERHHPQVDVKREPAGSTKCARKITELHKPCDIMAAADYKVIDKLLLPDHAVGNIRFATNQMVLCFTPGSTGANEITAANWMDILARPDVTWGHADPNLDPCGYRSLMVLQLAERHYRQPGMYDALYGSAGRLVRPKSVELISLLQSGNLDYAWEYRSVAVQHDLRYLELPAAIDLGDYRHDDAYAAATVEVTGKRPGTTMELHGKSITYGVTLIKQAPNRDAAIAFLAFMLDPDGGLKILADCGQPPFVPARVPDDAMRDALPAKLRPLVTVAK